MIHTCIYSYKHKKRNPGNGDKPSNPERGTRYPKQKTNQYWGQVDRGTCIPNKEPTADSKEARLTMQT